jgi:hypothetical protein
MKFGNFTWSRKCENLIIIINSYKKKQRRPPRQNPERGRGKLSPRNRKVCHSIGSALLQSVAEIGGTKSIPETLYYYKRNFLPRKAA